MTSSHRERWEGRDTAGWSAGPPSPFLLALADRLPRRGRALDVAGGTGRHALWLARRGLRVTLVDVAPAALARAQAAAQRAGLALHTVATDLAKDPPPPGPWDVILNVHVLRRRLFRLYPRLLAPGGHLLVEHPTRRSLRGRAPPRPEHLLEPGELPALADDLEILHHEEGWTPAGRHEARLLARKPSPEVVTAPFLSGAAAATGAAVVIDVFRAATTAAVLALRGGEPLLLAADPDAARALRRTHPDALLVGEVGGRKPPDFDHGNSPAELLRTPLRGRPVIFTTSAGTRGLLACRRADPVFFAGFVNAEVTFRRLLRLRPVRVTLVPLGWAGGVPAAEDAACAAYLAALFAGAPVSPAALVEAVRRTPGARKFGDPARPWFPPADRELCLDVDGLPCPLRLRPGSPPRLRPDP